jgi:hypothetical protein
MTTGKLGQLAGLGINWTMDGSNFDWTNPADPYGTFDMQFTAVANEIAPGIVSYAQSIQTGAESIIDAISRARLQLAMSDYQRDMLQAQIDRAKQGLPPVAPTASTGFDQKTILIGLAILAGLYLITRK